MRKNLLHSFLFVLAFWWGITTAWFSVANPEKNWKALERLHHLAPSLPLVIPKNPSALNALSMQLQVGKYWSIPVVALTGINALLGVGIAFFIAWRILVSRKRRETAGMRGWRKLRVTLGVLPVPPELPKVEADLELEEGEDLETRTLAHALDQLPDGHRKLIKEILEVLAAHPDAYVGAGHGVTLLEHSVGVLEGSLKKMGPDSDPLLPVAAIAHDLGKITSFVKDGEGGWNRVKWHDKETARILAAMDSWWNLSPEDRQILLLAVKYDHSMGNMPFFDDAILNRTRALQKALSGADREVTAQEKAEVLAQFDLPELAYQSWLKALPQMPLHVAGQAPPKGVRAAGWKKDGILYLLEHQCRERCLAGMDPEVAAAFGGNYRPQHKLAKFTEELMQGLHKRGVLITSFGAHKKVPPGEALWIIMSGTKEFKSVLAIRITPEIADCLPSAETAYDITVTGCLKQKGIGEVPVANVNLDNLLRTPAGESASGDAQAEAVETSGKTPALGLSEDQEERPHKPTPAEIVAMSLSAPRPKWTHPAKLAAARAAEARQTEATETHGPEPVKALESSELRSPVLEIQESAARQEILADEPVNVDQASGPVQKGTAAKEATEPDLGPETSAQESQIPAIISGSDNDRTLQDIRKDSPQQTRQSKNDRFPAALRKPLPRPAGMPGPTESAKLKPREKPKKESLL